MPSLHPIRNALVNLIASVPEIGAVHSYQRYAAREVEMLKLYLVPLHGREQVRGWFVQRVATREVGLTLGTNVLRVSWSIKGYMALSDADQSERVFDDLIESVRDAYRANPTLGGLVAPPPTTDEYGIQLDDAGPVFLAGVLCHSASLSLKTEVEI